MSLASNAQNSNVNENTASNSLDKSDSLKMDSIIHSLPDVMVKGNRPIVKVKGAALTYDLPQLLKNHPVDNAYEAIKQLPGVSEENDELTLNAQAVTVMIDGKATTMTSEQLYSLLKTIPTSRIDNAEVLYSAPARYQVKGQVINLQLKHNSNITALQGELFGGYTHRNKNRYTERASLLYTNKKWELDMLYSFSHGLTSKYYNNEFAHTLTDGTSYSYATRTDNQSRKNNHNIRLGINYNIAKNHHLSFAYTSEIGNRHTTSEDMGDFTSLLKINEKTQLHNFRLDYTAPFGLTAGAEYTYYKSPDEQWLRSSLFDGNTPNGSTSEKGNAANKSFHYDIASNQRINKWNFFVKQEHNLGKNWEVNYGATYTTSRDNSSQDYITAATSNPSSSGASSEDKNSIQTEDQVSFYIGASKSFGQKLSMEASLMEEYYHTSIWNEWNLFPTLSVTYLPKAGHILKFNLGSNRSYPTYWSVKNFTTYSFGGYGKIVGNPDLKPARNFGMSLTYVLHSRYVATLFTNDQKDVFRQLPYQSSTAKEMEYKFTNFDYSRQTGIILTVPINIGSWWQNRLTLIGVYQNDKNSHFYDIPFDRSKWFCQAKWNGTFLFGKHVIFNLDAAMHTPSIQGIIDIPSSGNIDAAITWKPLTSDKLTMKAYCNDIFETGDNHLHDTYQGQHVINELHQGRQLGISLTYRFGGYKTKKHEQVDTSRFGK